MVKKIGVLTSVNLNHATPAAFYAHQASRSNYYEIGQELIASGFDYFAGGGLLTPTGKNKDLPDLYEVAQKAGYTVTTTQSEIEGVSKETGKVIAIDENLADSDSMAYAMDLQEGQWELADYVEKGLVYMEQQCLIYNNNGHIYFSEWLNRMPLILNYVGRLNEENCFARSISKIYRR